MLVALKAKYLGKEEYYWTNPDWFGLVGENSDIFVLLTSKLFFNPYGTYGFPNVYPEATGAETYYTYGIVDSGNNEIEIPQVVEWSETGEIPIAVSPTSTERNIVPFDKAVLQSYYYGLFPDSYENYSMEEINARLEEENSNFLARLVESGEVVFQKMTDDELITLYYGSGADGDPFTDFFEDLKTLVARESEQMEQLGYVNSAYDPSKETVTFKSKYLMIEEAIEEVVEEPSEGQITVVSEDTENGDASMRVYIGGYGDSFSIYVNGVLVASEKNMLSDDDYYFETYEVDSVNQADLWISNLRGKTLNIDISADAEYFGIDSSWVDTEVDGSGRSISVNQFPEGINNFMFSTWQAELFVPETLPNNITSLKKSFYNSQNFNSDISAWDTSRVTDMSEAFSSCYKFNQDLSGWDVSNVTDMSYMFNGAEVFNADLSGWDVGRVENFENAFHATEVFDSNLSSWDVASAKNMKRMFSDSSVSSIFESWDTSNVTNMDYMFQPTSGEVSKIPVQDLSGWCVSKIVYEPQAFINNEWQGIKPVWGTCPRGENLT